MKDVVVVTVKNHIGPLVRMCSNTGKIVKKIIIKLLTLFLEYNHFLRHSFLILHQSQHGFIHGRSTVTNLLSFDNRIVDILSKGHLYDIITIDFKKTFDKASHTAIFLALANAGIADKALARFISFFDKCTQQVKMGDYYSKWTKVFAPPPPSISHKNPC